jgi:hypothetical protein
MEGQPRTGAEVVAGEEDGLLGAGAVGELASECLGPEAGQTEGVMGVERNWNRFRPIAAEIERIGPRSNTEVRSRDRPQEGRESGPAGDLPACRAFGKDFSCHPVALEGSGNSGICGDVDERFDEFLWRHSQIQGDPQLPSQRLLGAE